MATAIKVSDELVSQAKIFAKKYHRSVPKQIEYWSEIGRMAEERGGLDRFLPLMNEAEENNLYLGNTYASVKEEVDKDFDLYSERDLVVKF